MASMQTMPADTAGGNARYVPLCALASGGMAHVDLVVRRAGSFERVYAMKRMLPRYATDPGLAAMFLEEARIAGHIQHANVVSVLDVGTDADGPFLVMDFIDGVSLTELIRALQEQGRMMPVQLCLLVAKEMAAGLHAAHSLHDHYGDPIKVVHRDISPSNVLVGYDGVTRITDFGVAKILGQSVKTTTGILKGKLSYMAPELLRFERADHRVDLFALGVTLCELLSTDRLYGGADQHVVARQILDEPPPDLGEICPDAPPALVELGFELLAKKPDDRPHSAQVVVQRLQVLLADLVAGEGLLDLGQFVGDLFAEQRVAQHTRIRASVARIEESTRSSEHSLTHATKVYGKPSRRLATLAALGATAIAITVFAVAALTTGASEDEVSQATPSAVRDTTEPSAASKATAATVPAKTVVVTVETEPSGATVTLGEVDRGQTPVSVQVDAGARRRALRISKEGFLPIERKIVARDNQRHYFSLTASGASLSSAGAAARPAPRRSTPKPTTSPEKKPGLFRRFGATPRDD